MLQLTDEERADIILVKVVDAFWQKLDYSGWWNGEDALTPPDADGFNHPLLYFPGFTDQLRRNLQSQGLKDTRGYFSRWGIVSDYVLGEYVHKSELCANGKMRVVPNTLNILVERYFGAFKRLFGYQLANWYSPKKINMVVGGRGSGKCISSGTLITMSDGSRKPVEKVKTGDRVATLDLDTLKITNSSVVATIKQEQTKLLYKLTLRSGRTLTASYDHPVLTPYGWTNISDLKIGDRVAQPITLDREVEFGKTPKNLAIILALLIAEGGLTGKSISFSNSSKVLVGDLQKALYEWGNFSLAAHKGSNLNYYIRDNERSGVRNNLISLLRELGLFGTNSYQKFVPEFVFSQSNEWIAVFLGYLFAGDGSAYVKRCGKKRSGEIIYSSASETLVNDVRDLLLLLGIHSVTRYKPVKFRGKIYDSWEARIPYSHDRRRFVDLIYVPTKQDKFIEVANLNGVSNSSDDVYPLDLIKNYSHQKAVKVGKPFGLRLGDTRPYSNFRPRYNLTREKLKKLAEFLDNDAYLQKLANSDVIWSSVMAVEKLREDVVYDLEIENHHNFIASGVIVHNSQALAIIAGIHLATHPGEDWLHIALTLDQAIEVYDKLKDMATKRAYLSTGELCPRTFADTFFWKGGNPMVSHPYPKLIFEPWDNDDAGEDERGVPLGGNTLTVRALGDERQSERRRGKTIGILSGDELFRELEQWETITKVADAIRGPNEYKLAKLSTEQKQEYLELTRRLRVAEERGDEERSLQLSQQREAFNVEKTGKMFIVGNSGAREWVYEFEDEYDDSPVEAKAWFIRVSMYDNPNLTAADRRGYEERWANNPEERDVELMGNRPVGLGGEIDPELLRSAIMQRPWYGTTYKAHRSHGILHYMRPPLPDHYYMIVGDLGLDRAPKRNAPCIMVWEFGLQGGMELVYFWWGWERKKTYEWFLQIFRECMLFYPVLDPSFWVYDSGGTQAGTFEVFRSYMGLEEGSDDIFGYPMRMLNIQKETAKKSVIHALQNKWLRYPEIKAIIAQTSNWNLEMDREGQPQDVTMVLFMSVMRGWQILNNPSIVQKSDDDLIADPWSGNANWSTEGLKPLIKR